MKKGLKEKGKKMHILHWIASLINLCGDSDRHWSALLGTLFNSLFPNDGFLTFRARITKGKDFKILV